MLTIPHALEVDPAFAPVLRLAENIYLTPRELARHWRMSVAHLGVLRHQGKGPAYTKIAGRVIYSHADVLAYEQSRQRGPTTPTSLALAIATVPGLSPATRELIAAHVTAVLFPPSTAEPRTARKSKRRVA
jgi:hypothetical protein